MTPTDPKPMTVERLAEIAVRFWLHVHKRGADECWPWTGYRNHAGYGVFFMERKTKRAHRVSWRIVNGPIPNGMCVLHRCDNPPCVNPSHLFLGTIGDNVNDMVKKGRYRNANAGRTWKVDPKHIQRGESHPAAKLTEAAVREMRRLHRAGMRQCALAKQFGISRHHVSGIMSGKKWSHVED